MASIQKPTPSRPSISWDDAGANADDTWIPYKVFTADAVEQNLFLDEYDPTGGAGSYPAAVMVHGGGFVAGCRTWMDGISWHLAEEGFIVFNIDIRLACDPEVEEGVYLCGYPFPTPVDDVKSAIIWVRQHAGDYLGTGQTFNGNVAAFGTSGGGNQVMMAAATGNQYSTPDAVVTASGFAELGNMSTGDTVCEESHTPAQCNSNAEDYMGSTLVEGDWCLVEEADPDNWWPAGPVCRADGSEPPVYIVNGTHEASTWKAADDLAFRLGQLEIPFLFCSVSQNDGLRHGTELFAQGVVCDVGTGLVVDRVFAWLVDELA